MDTSLILTNIYFTMPQSSGIISAIIAVFALMVSAFVSASEIAYFSITPQQREDLEEAKEDNDTVAEKILTLLEMPEKLLATILIANNLVNIAVVVLLNNFFSQTIRFDSSVLDFLFQSVFLTFLLLLCGEILPKLYATNNNVQFARFASSPLSILNKSLTPISMFLVKSSVIVNKVVTPHGNDISTEDLSKALEITNVSTENERQMLKGILNFGETTASEVMRPRVDIVAIDITYDFDHVMQIVIETGYSRIPVYGNGLDDIKGILFAKDLLPFIGKVNKTFKWQRLLKEAYFIPESRMIDDLLEDFRKRKRHIAIVVDEFGGTQGLVTLEDVLEEIVGEINDEYDDEESFYTHLPDGSYIFEGKTLLKDFCRVTGLDESEFEDTTEEVDTLAGLLLSIKGDFPKEKEPIVYKNCRFLVLKIDKLRITKVRVKINVN